MSVGLRVRLKSNPSCVGTITGVEPAKPHHAFLLGTRLSFTVDWDRSPIRGLTYGEDVLEFLPESGDSGADRG